ncbi:MAG: GlsB/YeaQ/YmgE family stress response membrane protein [Actinobacteria bacterium]|nr:GlsB/YeaQ/YmgE family stress response membrane protein [Actinomycetota bacterium]MBI3686462.1 GlsB/YeaQ/YmgE family stress response membrane protein [Actinomycetota bacterium]
MLVGGFFSAIIVGAIVGYLGRWLAPKAHDRARIGMLLTVSIGVVAALAGTAIAHALHQDRFIATFPIQVVAAALFVSLFRRR